MRWWARGLSGVVSAALLLSLPGPAEGGPFRVRTELPPFDKTQRYEVVADGYALRRSYAFDPSDDTLAVFDLNDGRQLWSADLGVGNGRRSARCHAVRGSSPRPSGTCW